MSKASIQAGRDFLILPFLKVWLNSLVISPKRLRTNINFYYEVACLHIAIRSHKKKGSLIWFMWWP